MCLKVHCSELECHWQSWSAFARVTRQVERLTYWADGEAALAVFIADQVHLRQGLLGKVQGLLCQVEKGVASSLRRPCNSRTAPRCRCLLSAPGLLLLLRCSCDTYQVRCVKLGSGRGRKDCNYDLLLQLNLLQLKYAQVRTMRRNRSDLLHDLRGKYPLRVRRITRKQRDQEGTVYLIPAYGTRLHRSLERLICSHGGLSWPVRCLVLRAWQEYWPTPVYELHMLLRSETSFLLISIV